MNGEAQHQDRRQQRPHHDHHVWYQAWRSLILPIVLALGAEKKARDTRGKLRHPRRVARMKAQVTSLLRLRSEVRRIARAEGQERVRKVPRQVAGDGRLDAP